MAKGDYAIVYAKQGEKRKVVEHKVYRLTVQYNAQCVKRP